MKQNHIYFLLLVCSIFLSIVSPMLFSDGMFMDGIYYATISRNWAEGIGTFWAPHFTDTLGNPFYDHPPLMFFLEGVLFKLFGDHHWVERLYSLLTHLLMGIVLWQLWIQLCKEKYRNLFWLPLLFWISVSKVTWSACNNIIENTLMLFTSIAVLFIIKSIKSEKIYFAFLGGLVVFLGFLTKGLVALFPLSLPFFFWIFHKEFHFSQLLKNYLFLLFGLILPFILMYLFIPNGIIFFEKYLVIQVLNSLENVKTVDSRFFILRRFFEESLIMILTTLALIILNKYVFRFKFNSDPKKNSYLFTLIALVFSGVLPIIISLKQSTFYINPVFPITALIFGLYSAPIVSKLTDKINWSSKSFKIFKLFSISFFILSIILVLLPINEVKRDKKRISDILTVIEIVGENNTIYLSPEIKREWSLHAYFYRYGHLSLYGESPENFNFMISGKEINTPIPDGYQVFRDNLNELVLYKKIR